MTIDGMPLFSIFCQFLFPNGCLSCLMPSTQCIFDLWTATLKRAVCFARPLLNRLPSCRCSPFCRGDPVLKSSFYWHVLSVTKSDYRTLCFHSRQFKVVPESAIPYLCLPQCTLPDIPLPFSSICCYALKTLRKVLHLRPVNFGLRWQSSQFVSKFLRHIFRG